jgi:hypothetical protein
LLVVFKARRRHKAAVLQEQEELDPLTDRFACLCSLCVALALLHAPRFVSSIREAILVLAVTVTDKTVPDHRRRFQK